MTKLDRKRHLGHRAEIRGGADGLGRHFLEKHGAGLNLKDEKTFEENVMKHFKLTIIASVEPGQPWSRSKLDQLEGGFQKRLNCGTAKFFKSSKYVPFGYSRYVICPNIHC